MNAPSTTGNHLVGLEVLRFCCAMSILFWHYSHFGYLGSHQALITIEAQPLYRELRWLYSYGALSVQVFWCISGFVFAWKYGPSIRDGQMPASRFFWRRFSRLYPLHLATLLSVAGLQLLYHDAHAAYFVYPNNGLREFVLHLFFASNWLDADSASDYSFNGPVWSVSIEVLVYGLFFLMANLWGTSAWLAALTAIAAGGVFASGIGRNAVVLCIHYYFLGVLTAALYARISRSARPRRARILTWTAGLAVLAAVLAMRIKPTHALSLFVPFLLVFAIDAFARLDGPLRRWIGGAGELTYSIYMTHFPLQIVIVLMLARLGLEVPWNHWQFLAAFVTLSIGVGLVSYHLLEKPAMRSLRARFVA